MAAEGTPIIAPTSDVRAEPRTLPLTFIQRRLVESAIDHRSWEVVVTAWRARGALQVPILERAVGILAGRHQALRTTLDTHGPEPRQLIHPSLAIACEHVSASASAASVDDVLFEVGAMPFDLQAGRLVRLRLVRLARHDHVVVLAGHHLVLDGWSQRILSHELPACFAAAATNTTPDLAQPTGQFADYVLSQTKAGPQPRASDEDYWHRLLSRPAGELALQRTSGSRAVEGSTIVAQPFEAIRAETATRLFALGNRVGRAAVVTMVALIALGRWLPQRVELGMVEANRRERATIGMVGCLFDILPIRLDQPSAATPRDLVAIAAREHQQARRHKLPPAHLERLRSEHPSAGHYQAMINLLPYDAAQPPNYRRDGAAAQVTTAPESAELRQITFPAHRLVVRGSESFVSHELAVNFMQERDGSIGGQVEADTNRLSSSVIELLAERVPRAAELAVAHPDTPVSSLVDRG